MAFTKTPTTSTYQTKSIPLAVKWNQRSPGSQDGRLINGIAETTKTQSAPPSMMVYKRDGITHMQWQNATPPQPVHDDFGGIPVVGVYSSVAFNGMIVVIYNGTIGTATAYFGRPSNSTNNMFLVDNTMSTPLLNSVTNSVNFTDFTFDNGDRATFFGAPSSNTIYGYNWTSGFIYTIPSLPGSNADPVTLDGYVFISDINGNIYNSALNDPTTWNASNFISAESYGDRLSRIARSGSYIVAFGTNSIEWFYDAANPTGSPLSVYQGATRRVGILGGLAQNGDDLYFLGKSEGSPVALYKINGLKLSLVADFTGQRELNTLVTAGFSGGNNRSSNGCLVSMNGHTLYVFGGWNVGSPGSSQLTYYYDLSAETFGQLSFKDDNTLQMGSSTFSNFLGTNQSHMFNLKGSDRVYVIDPSKYQDDGVNYTVTIQTENQDFDSRRMKFGSRALVYADQPNSDSNLLFSWSVDDYKTFSPARAINLNDVYTSTWALGQFRKIGFKLQYSDNFPMRLENLELDYLIGNT